MNNSYLSSIQNAVLLSKPATTIRMLLIVLFVGLFANVANAQKIWDRGANTNNWGDANNWSGNTLPGSSDAVTITQGQSVVVNISTAVCASLDLSPTGSGTAALSFSASSQLVVSGRVSLGNSGNNNRIGTITMTNGGRLICTGFALANAGSNVFTQGTGTVELTATNTLPASFFTQFNNLIISGGKTTTGSALTIASLTVKSADEFALAHNVTATAVSLEAGCLTTGAVVSGSSTLTLGGNVTVTDNTGGTAGATISCPVSLNSATRTFTVADDGTAAADLTVSGIISTAAALTKSGAGTMVLSGANTYSGLTTVSAGTLALGVSSAVNTAGPLGTTGAGTTVSSGAALDLNGFSLTNSATEALSLNGTGISSGGALTNSSNTASNYIGLITLPAAASIVTNAGDINLTNTGALTSEAGILTIGGTGSIAGAFTTNSKGITKTGTGTWTVSGNSTYDGPTLISLGTLKLGSTAALGSANGSVTVSSGGALDLNGYSLTIAKSTTINGTGVGSLGAITNSSVTEATYPGIIVLGSHSSIVGETGSIVISSTQQVDGSTYTLTLGGTTGGSFSGALKGTGGLTKTGTGTWTINSLNYYNGATTISAGTLKLGVGVTGNFADRGPLGSNAAGTTVASGAVLDLNGYSINTSSTPEPLTINGTGLTASPAGALTNTGVAATFNGAIALGLASTITATSSGSLTCSGAVSGAFNLTLNGEGTGTMSGIIGTSAGTLTKNGTGTWDLSGTNTYTGATNVNAGTLNIQNARGTGTTAGGVTVDTGATLQLEGGIAVGAEALSLAGGGVDGNAAFDNVSGNNSWSGAITLAADATIRNQSNNLTISGTVALGGKQLTLGGPSTGGSISGIISGAGSGLSAIRKVTAGTWSLSGVNTFTGNILIQLGTLTVGNASALGANTNNLSISSGAVANLSSSETVGSLTLDVLGTQNGTWGSGTSSATFKDDIYFTSTGILTVSTDTRKNSSVTVTGTAPFSYVYDGTSKTPSFTSTGSTAIITYLYSGTGITGTTASVPINAGTYSVTASVAANRNYLSASSSATAFTINQKALTVTGATTANKAYDGTNTATVTGGSLVGVVGSDVVNLTQSGTFAQTGVGTGIAITSTSTIGGANAGNYTLTQPSLTARNITALALTVTGATTANKVYDRTNTATVTGGTLVGVINPDAVTLTQSGTFAQTGVGTGIAITSTSTIGGANAGNYTLTQPSLTARDITAKELTVTGATTANKAYDGTNTATVTGGSLVGVVGSDVVTLTQSGTFAQTGVGTSIAITSTSTLGGANAGNYTLTQPSLTARNITAKALTITGVTVSNKIYDNTTTASLNTASATLVGVVSPDVVTLNSASASVIFANANAGAGKTVTTSGFSIAGANAGNYTLTQPTGLTATISPRPVTLSGSRVYDNTDVAAATDLTITNNLDGANLTLSGSGSISLEDVGTRSINNASLPARVQFATAHSGGNPATSCIATFSAAPTNGNTLIAVITTRNNAANTVSSITQTGATWTRATQGVNTNGTTTEIWYAPARTALGASVTVTLNTVSVRTSLVVMEYSGILALSPLDSVNNDRGNSNTVTTNSITTTQDNELLIAGVGLVNSNYSLNSITNSFTTVANVATTNGTSSNNAETYALERIVTTAGTYSTGGTVSTSSQWSAAIASFKAVIPSGNAFVLGGSAASNYTLTGVSGSMEITPKNLTISGVFATNKEYDGTTVTTLNSDLASLSGVVSPDVVSIDSSSAIGTFASANVGTGIAVTASGFSLTGSNAGNYSVTQPTGFSANITPKGITIFANNSNKCLGSTLTFAGNEFSTSSEESDATITAVTLISAGAISSATVGSYTIVPSNAVGTGLSNYTINYVSGNLMVSSSPTTTGVSVCPGGSGALTSSASCISASISSGVNNPGSVANTTGIGNDAWSNPSNALTNNGAAASVTLSNASRVSNYLVSANHTFDIPSNAMIMGIKVVINKYATNFFGSTRLRDNQVRLVKSGTVVGDNKANAGADWPQTEQASTYGSVIDLWGTTWTAADINNANFGVALSVLNATSFFIPYSGEVDAISIEVMYSIPGTLNWFTASSGGTAIGSGSSFNPVGVAGSSLANTNTPGTTTFYAECSSLPGCRTATDFVITANVAIDSQSTATQTRCKDAAFTPITVTATGATGFQWYSNATNSNSGGTSLEEANGAQTNSYTPQSTVAGTLYYYCVVSGTCGLPATSNTVTMIVTPLNTIALTSAESSNNQSLCTPGQFVTITYATTGATGVNFTGLPTGLSGSWASNVATISGTPTLSGSFNYTVTLTGGCGTVAATGTIAVNTTTWTVTSGVGSWSNGTPTASVGAVISGNYTANVNLTACTLNVNNNAVVTVATGITVSIAGKLNVDSGSIIFENGSSLLQTTYTGANTGNIIYKRNYTGEEKDYTYWSSPVASQNLLALSPSTKLDKFFSFNGTDWAQENPSATTMTIGKGYIIRGIPPPAGLPVGFGTLLFNGVPNNGDKSITVVGGESSNLIGNPYPSAIYADKLLFDNKAVIDGTIYFWTHNTPIAIGTPNPGTGAWAYSGNDYAAYSLTGGVGTGSGTVAIGGSTKPTGFIAAGQSFFTTSTAAGGNVTFTNAMRVNGSGNPLSNSNFYKTKSPINKTDNTLEKNRIWLNLTNKQGAFKQTLVGYITGATNTWDKLYDGESFDGNDFLDFYSINEDKNLTIQGRGLPFDENDEIPLGYRIALEGTFTINIDETDGLLANQPVFLEDKLTNTVFDLKSGNYTFNTTAGTFDDRFVLRYKDKTLSTEEPEVEDGILVLYSNNYKTLIIRNNGIGTTVNSVTLYNMVGQKIAYWDVKGREQTSIQIPIKNLPSEIYIVKVKTTKGESNKKIIIK